MMATDISFFLKLLYISSCTSTVLICPPWTSLGQEARRLHTFAVSAWTYDAVKAVLAADRVTDTKYGKLQVSSGFFLYTTFLQIFAA